VKILVDTSVWSLALRRGEGAKNKEAEILKRLIADGEDIFLLGIILQEVLQGIKRQRDFKALKEYFQPFPLIDIKREDYINAAMLKNRLMKKGIQASTVDALIASVAVAYDCLLFTADSDFVHIGKHTDLKLLKY